MSFLKNAVQENSSLSAVSSDPRRPAYLWGGISFLFFFIMGILVTNSLLQRKVAISAIKSNYAYVIGMLNETGIDIAYDDLKFNVWWPLPLAEVKNLKIYVPGEPDNFEWTVRELSVKTGLLSAANIDINISKEQSLKFSGSSYGVNIRNYKISIENNKNELNSLAAEFYDTGISNIAEIGKITLAVRRIAPQQINDNAPFLKTYVELRDIQLNGLLNYPLSQKIDKIYLDSDIIARIKKDGNGKSSIHNWLSRGGKINVKALTLNWLPLLLVGKGDILFDENVSPSVRLQTSSKALLDLINELESKKTLDSKGVFVAKILLGNKAYKEAPSDKHLTVSTPIDYKDGVVSVEKIAVYNSKEQNSENNEN